MTARTIIPVSAVGTLFVAFLCVISLTTRDHGLTPAIVADSGQIEPVEGRRRHPLTPEEQARRDHLRQQRAARWGIFMHYLVSGVATVNGGGGLFSWGTGLISSLFQFAWTVGTDLLILVALAFVLVAGCGLFVVFRFARWLFSKGA